MKKYLKVIAAVLVAVLMLCSLAGCQKSLDKAIIGSWESPDPNNNTTIEFREDNTVTFDFGSITILGVKRGKSVNGTYTLDMEKEPAQVNIVIPRRVISAIGVDYTLTFNVIYEDEVLTLSNSDMNIQCSLVRSEHLTKNQSNNVA